jgi:uncharacterized repeat protein (TIGR02543 family)
VGKKGLGILVVIGLAIGTSSQVSGANAKRSKTFASCTALLKTYKNGVASSKKTKGKTKATLNSGVFKANRSLDRNRNGIVCDRGDTTLSRNIAPPISVPSSSTPPTPDPPSTTPTTAAETTTVPTTFSVTYNGNAQTSGSVPTDTNAFLSGASATVAGNTSSLAKAGYVFDGWCTTQPSAGAACGAVSLSAGSTIAVSSSVILYAVWTPATYSLTYDANSANSGTVPSSGTVTFGSSFTAPTNAGNLTRNGYNFAGWSTSRDGSGTSYAAGSSFVFDLTANTTLYAKWTAVPCSDGGVCAVGDMGPGGGVVFYVGQTNFYSLQSACYTQCKYLEVAPEPGGGDVSRTWSTGGNQRFGVDGADDDTVGGGASNTLDIKNQSGNTGDTTAAIYAFDYVNGGKTDWHLPSYFELNELCKYARQQTTGNTGVMCNSSGSLRSGFSTGSYWSSSENRDYGADAQSFDNGSISLENKSEWYQVRPIRAF